jgi:hypothetical protein
LNVSRQLCGPPSFPVPVESVGNKSTLEGIRLTAEAKLCAVMWLTGSNQQCGPYNVGSSFFACLKDRKITKCLIEVIMPGSDTFDTVPRLKLEDHNTG